MKFSTALTSLILLVPLFAGEAFASPFGGQGKGGFGGNKGGANKAANNKGAAAASNSSAAAAAANTTAAAANSSAAANSGAAAAAAAAAGAGNTGNATANNPNVQDSLTLDPSVIATGFEQNGQETPAAGQVASLTSSNNFINFCATVPNKPITNGQQIKTGSCNPAPMGIIAATTNMPSAKFVNPVNGQDVAAANTAFNMTVAINNLETGNFVNADANYYSAPQQINQAGDIIGHSHFTVQAVPSFTSTTPLDPNVFAFFKGINQAATNGQVSEAVTAGLPAGVYRACTINTDANHAPCLVAVAQHGSLDDCVYFSVGGAGGASPFGAGSGSGAAAAASNATAAASNSTAAASKAATGAAAAGAGAAAAASKSAAGAGAATAGKAAAAAGASEAAAGKAAAAAGKAAAAAGAKDAAAGKAAAAQGKADAAAGAAAAGAGKKAGARRFRLGDRLGRDY